MESKKRHSYTVEFKRKVVEFADAHGNRAAGKKFFVNESMVRRWKKNKDLMSKLPGKLKAMRGGKAHWPDLELDLKDFVLGKRGRGLSTVIIGARAQEMARDRGITNFIGGPAWCHRFMKRHGLYMYKDNKTGETIFSSPDNRITAMESDENIDMYAEAIQSETELTINTTSKNIKIENAGLTEGTHPSDNVHLPDVCGTSALTEPFHEQVNGTSLQSETELLTDATCDTHIKIEDAGLAGCTHPSDEFHHPDCGVSALTKLPHEPANGTCTSFLSSISPDAANSYRYIVKREDSEHPESLYQQEQCALMDCGISAIQPSYEQKSETSRVLPHNEDLGYSDCSNHLADSRMAISQGCFSDGASTESAMAPDSSDKVGTDNQQSQNAVSWSCPTCNQTFLTRDSLHSHEEIHSVTHWFMCNICLKTFTQKRYLTRHIKRLHTNTDSEERFVCTVCHETFNTSSRLREHANCHTKEHLYSCDKCECSYNCIASLNYHKKTHSRSDFSSGNEPYACDMCSRGFKEKRYLQRHNRKHHARNKEAFVCAVCDRAFSNRSSLKDHTNTHTKEKVFRCDKCEQIYYNRSTFKHHKLTHVVRKPEEVDEQFVCGICSREFTKKVNLQSHIRRVHPTDKQEFQCTFCQKTFTRSSHLKEHTNIHTKDKKYFCDLCERFYYTRGALKTHKKTHSRPPAVAKKPPSCEICQRVFPNRSKLADHVRSHTLERPFHCNDCPASFKTSNVLKSHRRIHSNVKPFECSTCSKCFRRKSALKEHSKVHASDRVYKCKVCSETFEQLHDLREHGKTHPKPVETREKRFVCDVCFKGFCGQFALKNHHISHLKEKPFSCTECEKKFKHKVSLRLHKSVHSGQRSYKCSICEDRAFYNRRTLNAHMKFIHSDAHDFKLFACGLCDKRYGTKSTLKSHMQRHADEKQFACSVCGRAFYTSNALRNHTAVHRTERPYACNICDRTFKTKSMLKSHQRSITHSDERPFLCEICGQTFANSSGLGKHSVIHSGVRPYVCELCGKSCSRKDNLKTHMKVHSPSRHEKRTAKC